MGNEKRVSLQDDLKRLIRVAGQSLERWKTEIVEFHSYRSTHSPTSPEEALARLGDSNVRPGVTVAFHRGWSGGEDACFPRASLEDVIAMLRTRGYSDQAELVKSNLDKMIYQLPSLEVDLDDSYWHEFQETILEPLRRDLDSLINTCCHAEDFSSIVWYGKRHLLSKGQQRNVVQVLWEAWERGTITLTEDRIGIKIGSDAGNGFRLAHVFRKHPTWKEFIKDYDKRVFGLNVRETEERL